MNKETQKGIPAEPAPTEAASPERNDAELKDDELNTVSAGMGGFTLAFNASKNANNGEG